MAAPVPLVTALSRKWAARINIGTDETPSWLTIKGINTFKYNPAIAVLQDDNVYEANGRDGKTKTSLGSEAELKILRRHANDDVTDYDAGQEALRAKSMLFGSDGWAHCQIYDRNGGPEAYEDYFEVSWAADGGGTGDLETVTVTLASKGSTTEIVNPIDPSGS